MLAYFMTYISCHIDHGKLLSEIVFQILSENSIPEFIFLRATFALTNTFFVCFSSYLIWLFACLFVGQKKTLIISNICHT